MRRIFYTILLLLVVNQRLLAQCAYFTTLQSGPAADRTLGIKSDGTLWAWGNNEYERLGVGSTGNKNTPVQVGEASNWVSISTGAGHTLGLKNDGTLWVWGTNYYGELGNGASGEKIPVQMGANNDWASVSAGTYYSMAIKTNGTLWAWGSGEFGMLGNGANDDQYSPVQVGMASDWAKVSAGGIHTLGIKNDGTLWTWGYNGQGQLGDGSTLNRTTPARVGISADWISVSAGSSHSLGIRSDGTLWAWGGNSSGQLGDGTDINKNTPVQIGNTTRWLRVTSTAHHTIGITLDGKLWAWGYNAHGELGDGTNINRSTPTQIGTASNWVSVSMGRFHSLGITSDGKPWAWGANDFGQLGDGSNAAKYTPVPIATPPAFSGGLAPTQSVVRMQQGQYNMFSSACTLIASLGVDRGSPVSVAGPVTAMVWVEGAQPTNYVRRHYEISPDHNAANASGRVTLYFTQSEFNDFNIANTIDLPAHPGDDTGIANLRIEKRGGTSSDNTGRPTTYPGTIVTIDPINADIVWNAIASRWEVSFNTVGFSGFFVKTSEAALPVRLLTFEATDIESKAFLRWQTATESNASHFEIERSTDAKHFERIAQVKATGNSNHLQTYTFVDDQFAGLSRLVYYRVRTIDVDGTFAFSLVKPLSHPDKLNIYPNPAKIGDLIKVEADRAIMELSLLDVSGRTAPVLVKGKGNKVAEINTANLPGGLYIIQFRTENGTNRQKLVVE